MACTSGYRWVVFARSRCSSSTGRCIQSNSKRPTTGEYETGYLPCYKSLWRSTADMNLFDLTPQQLKRAASLKERIDGLNKQLRGILGGPATSRAAPPRNRTMSASVKKKIATTQRARWAKVRSSKPTTVSARPAAKKTVISTATRAKLSAKLKAYWAAKKKSGKK